jgi:hypothetical protein
MTADLDGTGRGAYLKEIENWRDILHGALTDTLKMEGIKDAERKELTLALDCVASIDHLVRFITETVPHAHDQAYALSRLWSAIGAAFVTGKYDSENPIARTAMTRLAARARSFKPRIRDRDKIMEVIERHRVALWARNPKRVGNANATAADILPGVNSDLAGLGIKPLSRDGLRKKLRLLKLAA